MILVDTSVAVAFVVSDHEAHAHTWEAIAERRLGLAGHAWFETFSVLTRLPGSSRRDPTTIASLLFADFPESRFLSEQAVINLTGLLGEAGIGGGAVYDALVAATAAHHNLPLASRDRRALDIYRTLGVEVEFLD